MEDRLREQSGLARLGEVAAVLAHEVKNPLAAVSGAVQIIAGHLTDPEDLEVVAEIQKRLTGLSTLVGDLLLYARPPRPQPTAFDLADLTAALVTFLGADPAWRSVDVVVEGGAVAMADAELLRIALQNLLINAGEAMTDGGRLHVAISASNGLTHVDVTDAGPGIPAAAQANVFKPFFTTKPRGTGLGLGIARRIAEAHGGSVDILRTGPAGTTVRLTLPGIGR
jgi:signal transduction histidine kinase